MAGEEDMEFGDIMFGMDEDREVERPPEPRETHHQRSVSALTVRVKKMDLGGAVRQPGGFNNWGQEVVPQQRDGVQPHARGRSIAAEMNGALEGGEFPRMGTSAPVLIPDSRRSMHHKNMSMRNVEEEIQDELHRSSTFIPPHKLANDSDRNLIEFSLNNSRAEKRANLRARTEILQLTGFIEMPPAQDSHNRRPSIAKSDMIVNFGDSAERSGMKAGALSREFAPADSVGT